MIFEEKPFRILGSCSNLPNGSILLVFSGVELCGVNYSRIMRYFDEYLSDPAYDESRQLALYVKKLNTSEKSIRDGVLHLKQWIEMQPHLPKISGDQLFVHIYVFL